MRNPSPPIGSAPPARGLYRLVVAVVLLGLAGCTAAPKTDAVADEGMAFLRGRMYEPALERFDEALRLDPQHRTALQGAGATLLGLGRADEAQERMLLYVELEPGDAAARVDLARAEAALGRKEDAIASLRAAVEAGLDDPRAVTSDGFDTLRGDLRFIQIAALVAQRAGVRPTDDRGRLLVGGEPVRKLDLPPQEAAE